MSDFPDDRPDQPSSSSLPREEVHFPGSSGDAPESAVFEPAAEREAHPDLAGTPPPATPPAKGRNNCLIFAAVGGLLVVAVICAALVVIGAAGIFIAREAEGLAPIDIEETAPIDGGVPSTGGTQTDVLSLTVGDCYNDPASGGEGVIEQLEVIPCDQPHDRELFAVLSYPAGPDEPFPGEDAFQPYQEEECVSAFEEYVGLPYDESVLYLSTLTPTEGSWGAGDREIFCILYEPDTQLTGSMQGSER